MFSINDYDDKGVLKPGTFLIIANLYVARFLLFGPLSLLAKFRGFSSGPSLDTSFLTDVSPFEMLSSIPATVVLFIMLARSPQSAAWMRRTWDRGRLVLLACLSVQIIIQVIRIATANDLSLSDIVTGTLNLFFVIYFSTAARPRSVFAMFPQPKSKNESTNP
ncbi:MAG: DUF2919 family protein [Pseudomonadales bacterium]|nr:DUF2919 family protein [Pseudomonadales bacterium]MBO6596121.1 DUF2919 family protein [Pseudomonadales bacterium]MBO6822603.1 DUF2919 family protein [Pseudomonadales bacterium]